MLNQNIPKVDDYKHFGIIVSYKCSWDSHLDYMTEKAWERVNIMQKLKFLEIINACFIRPIPEYADVVWGNAFQLDLDILDKFLNGLPWVQLDLF